MGGLVDVAHRLEMACCAVGVESAEQLEILDELQCDLAQGFYIGAPLPAARLPQALDEWSAEVATKAAKGVAR